MKQWMRQYTSGKEPGPSGRSATVLAGAPKSQVAQLGSRTLTTAGIPFPAPNVQSEPSKKQLDLFETAGFDPSKPPPNATDANK